VIFITVDLGARAHITDRLESDGNHLGIYGVGRETTLRIGEFSLANLRVSNDGSGVLLEKIGTGGKKNRFVLHSRANPRSKRTYPSGPSA